MDRHPVPPAPPSRPGRRAPRCAAALALLLAAGCASWPAHGVRPGPEGTFRIALLPVAVTAHARHLSDLETLPPPPPPPPSGAAERARIDAALAAAGARMTASLAERLRDAPPLAPVAVPEAAAGADPAAAARVAGADAALVVELSGYGRIKGRWVTYLIGSGVVEAAVQGVVAARVVHNGWVGLAVGLEELGSEVLTWGGGAWLFNAWYAPVTLQARLVAARDGRTVWRDLVFVPRDRKALKALPPERRARREVQLAATSARAEAELVEDLAKAARRALKPPRQPRTGRVRY